MAQTKFDICNRAISLCGVPARFESFEDGTMFADIFSVTYAPAKESLLSMSSWDFAVKTLDLPAAVTFDAHPNYEYEFLLPTTMMKLLVYYTTDGGTRLTDIHRMGGVLYANNEDVSIMYVDNVDEDCFTALFAETLAFKLAFENVQQISGQGTDYDRLRRDYMEIKDRAVVQDAQALPPGEILESSSLLEAHNSTFGRSSFGRRGW